MKTCFTTACTALHYLANGAGDHYFDASPETRKLISQEEPWLNIQRNQIQEGFEALLHGSCDAANIPRIELPAEYVAAAIALVVKPANTQKACSWLADQSNGAIGQRMEGDERVYETVSNRRLFDLVLTFGHRGTEIQEFRAKWEARVDNRIYGMDPEHQTSKGPNHG